VKTRRLCKELST